MGIFGGTAPEKMMERLGTTDAPWVNQPTAAIAWYLGDTHEDGSRDCVPPDAWQAYQTARGICWHCGDRLLTGARYCITCGVAMPHATGDTERLYVPPTLGATERLS